MTTCKLALNDIYAYADDLLILCDTQQQVANVTSQLSDILEKYRLFLNKDKSGIVEFTSRRSRPRDLTVNLNGYPVLPKYKYLRTWFNNKLTVKDQLDHVKSKGIFIFNKLKMFIRDTSADLRLNLWILFLRPLFEFTFPLLAIDNTQTHKKNVMLLFKKTFKLFIGVSKNTEDTTIHSFLGYNPSDRINLMRTEIVHSTTMRFAGIVYNTNKVNTWEGNSLSRLPSNFIRFVNLQSAMCPQHPQMRFTNHHFNHLHRLPHMRIMPSISELISKYNKKKR